MTVEQLNTKKERLLKKVKKLSTLKKELYSEADIESPMSSKEKELSRQIALLFSEINEINKQKRAISQ